jgi:hypothetical protein
MLRITLRRGAFPGVEVEAAQALAVFFCARKLIEAFGHVNSGTAVTRQPAQHAGKKNDAHHR